jgi:hypothetical protein
MPDELSAGLRHLIDEYRGLREFKRRAMEANTIRAMLDNPLFEGAELKHALRWRADFDSETEGVVAEAIRRRTPT